MDLGAVEGGLARGWARCSISDARGAEGSYYKYRSQGLEMFGSVHDGDKDASSSPVGFNSSPETKSNWRTRVY